MTEKPPFKAPTLEELAIEPWVQKAAAEAREASRKHWAGEAGRRFPVLPTPGFSYAGRKPTEAR